MDSDSISYDCFEELIVSLRADGLSDKARMLYTLLHDVAWTTGSELIGELGSEIKRIEKDSSLQMSVVTRNKIDECFQIIRRVWPDFPL